MTEYTIKTWEWLDKYRDLIVRWRSYHHPVFGEYMIAVLSNGTEVAIRD